MTGQEKSNSTQENKENIYSMEANKNLEPLNNKILKLGVPCSDS